MGLPGGHLVEPHLHAVLALGAHLGGGAGDAGRAHVLHAYHAAGGDDLQSSLQQQLLLEGVAYLHRGQLVGGGLGDVLRGEGCPVNAVFASGRAHDEHRVADAMGGGADGVANFHDPGGEGVDKGVGMK